LLFHREALKELQERTSDCEETVSHAARWGNPVIGSGIPVQPVYTPPGNTRPWGRVGIETVQSSRLLGMRSGCTF